MGCIQPAGGEGGAETEGRGIFGISGVGGTKSLDDRDATVGEYRLSLLDGLGKKV